jgi:hypothetical protein
MALNASLALAMLGGTVGGFGRSADPATAIATFRRAVTPAAEAKGIAAEGKDPVTLRAVEQFSRALDKATDLGKALGDPRILGVLLPALGLADKAAYPAMVRRALLSDPTDAKGLARQLGEPWSTATQTLRLHATGLAGLKDPAMVKTLTEGFLAYRYRTGLDEEAAGVSDALYFREKAGTVRDVYTILGDPVMRRVVTGALGLPGGIAVQSVEAQARAVSSRLDLDTLQKPAEVQKLIARYLISRAGSTPGAGGPSPPSLFA